VIGKTRCGWNSRALLLVTICAVDSPGEDESNVDREIRIERMKRELEELIGGEMISGSVGKVLPKLEEVFLERACTWEKAPRDTNFNRLIRRGVEMIPPAELDDGKLRVKLQEVLCALLRSIVFYTTRTI
jgi:hypothetical protein